MPTPSPAGPKQHNWLLVAGVIALALFPVLFVRGEHAGSDGQGTEAIQYLQPGYKPWFEPVVELPSGEIESLMFAMARLAYTVASPSSSARLRE